MKLFVNRAAWSAAFVLASAAAASAAATPAHVRGTITAISGSSFTVKTATGSVVLSLGPKTGFAGALPATLDAITPGTFIGSANVGSNGPARALEVVVFPPSMKGTGEGDYPWDLPASGGAHSAMTNGTVSAPHMSSMTNATVRGVTSGSTRTLSVAYKGGTKQITVTPQTPIVRLAPGTKSLLMSGARVFVVAVPAAGAMNAAFVVVGEHGTVPPM